MKASLWLRVRRDFRCKEAGGEIRRFADLLARSVAPRVESSFHRHFGPDLLEPRSDKSGSSVLSFKSRLDGPSDIVRPAERRGMAGHRLVRSPASREAVVYMSGHTSPARIA